MIDIARLKHIGGLLACDEIFYPILARATPDRHIWENGHARFPIPAERDWVGDRALRSLCGLSPLQIEHNLLIYPHGIPPHRHRRHDGVMILKAPSPEVDLLNWERLLGNGAWDQVCNGEYLILPRDTWHGLRPLPGAKPIPLPVISVNSPPGEEDDIVYLDP
jgi:hypothetical protein